MVASNSNTPVQHLVLDAGPLLSLAPLRGLAEHYYTVPQVVVELRDKHAREYFEKLVLAGVGIQVRNPDVAALAHVTQFAKKTGDYSVLSQADLCVLALTYSLSHAEGKQPSPEKPETSTNQLRVELTEATKQVPSDSGDDLSPDVSLSTTQENHVTPNKKHEDEPLQPHNSEDESSSVSDASDVPSDDGEGEWITPSNVALHKSRALNLLPGANHRQQRKHSRTTVACMTADFAMQNVLMQLGLRLVDVDGKRISSVKSWVLRCHACFKICKDMSKKFCPSCGNPSLLRTSVSISTPSDGSQPTLKVHLKKNYQYRTRGTIYSIPSPKPGSSKTGTGEGLILREDQVEWVRAEKQERSRLQKEERKLVNAIKTAKEGETAKIGTWMDPDWVPEMLTVGMSGKGRKTSTGMPNIGYGRRNPNERRRRK